MCIVNASRCAVVEPRVQLNRRMYPIRDWNATNRVYVLVICAYAVPCQLKLVKSYNYATIFECPVDLAISNASKWNMHHAHSTESVRELTVSNIADTKQRVQRGEESRYRTAYSINIGKFACWWTGHSNRSERKFPHCGWSLPNADEYRFTRRIRRAERPLTAHSH